jgi:hypothetical protein
MKACSVQGSWLLMLLMLLLLLFLLDLLCWLQLLLLLPSLLPCECRSHITLLCCMVHAACRQVFLFFSAELLLNTLVELA